MTTPLTPTDLARLRAQHEAAKTKEHDIDSDPDWLADLVEHGEALLALAEEAIALRERVATLEQELWRSREDAVTNATNAAEALLREADLKLAGEAKDALLLRAQRVISRQRTDDALLDDIEHALGLLGEEKCQRPDCEPCQRAREELIKP